MNPSSQPSSQPSPQPSRQPSRQPTASPSSQPTGLPTSQPSRQPTSQPSRQPSVQPTLQPIGVPTSRPSVQPSGRPTGQPRTQPTSQPSLQPVSCPSALPSSQPSRRPSSQPSSQPLNKPTLQPSAQPLGKPSAQPSGQPTSVPSSQPSAQPTTGPSTQPSTQPSNMPSGQPSAQPLSNPSAQPSAQPTSQPSAQPSAQPWNKPSSAPTSQPSSSPSVQPSRIPTGKPSAQPSTRPSPLPSGQPSSQPSMQPRAQPSGQPTSIPSTQPTLQPIVLPSARPSTQPSSQPSTQPLALPTLLPSAQPSSQPSCRPSAQPTAQPSSKPSAQPSNPPSVQPSSRPSAQPSSQPSVQPSTQPTAQPSCHPTLQPSRQPSRQPSDQPSSVPSVQPSAQPTAVPREQPSSQPSLQPASAPSSVPTSEPTFVEGEWVTLLRNSSSRISSLTYIGNSEAVWACSTDSTQLVGSLCTLVDAVRGSPLFQYSFPYSNVLFAAPSKNNAGVVVSGSIFHSYSSTANIADCMDENGQLLCTAVSFTGTIASGSYSPSVEKFVYIGTYGDKTVVTVVNQAPSGGSVRKQYWYSTTHMEKITFSYLQSLPNFVGSFIVGTCQKNGLASYLFAGMVRTDSGTMTAMYVAPVSGNILNSAELVNAMAQEALQPDSFIAGGLQLSDGAGMHAYLVRVNTLYREVKYGMRYVVQYLVGGNRRVLTTTNIFHSAVKGMVLDENFLYMLVNLVEKVPTGANGSISVLKINIVTGDIVQQVHIHSHTASIQCTDIVASGLSLVMGCTVNSTQTIVLSASRKLTFSKLPGGFLKHENNTFVAEPVAFKSTTLALGVNILNAEVVEYTFTPTDGFRIVRPTMAPISPPPSSIPSVGPSSSPTAAPSVSPQPSSQPSSSGPTNTNKPTVKPTQRSSKVPTRLPTVLPSALPTTKPTARPSGAPSTAPSAQPSVGPTVRPTRCPTVNPNRFSSAHPTNKLTVTPSIAPTLSANEGAASSGNPAYAIFGYVVAGLVGLWLLWFLRRWCAHKLMDVQSDANRKLYVESMGYKPIPRFPIFTFLISLCFTIDAVEVDFITVEADTVVAPPEPRETTRVNERHMYHGFGANLEGAVGFRDLEANMTNIDTVASDRELPVSQITSLAGLTNTWTNGHNMERDGQDSSISSANAFSELDASINNEGSADSYDAEEEEEQEQAQHSCDKFSQMSDEPHHDDGIEEELLFHRSVRNSEKSSEGTETSGNEMENVDLPVCRVTEQCAPSAENVAAIWSRAEYDGAQDSTGSEGDDRLDANGSNDPDGAGLTENKYGGIVFAPISQYTENAASDNVSEEVVGSANINSSAADSNDILYSAHAAATESDGEIDNNIHFNSEDDHLEPGGNDNSGEDYINELHDGDALFGEENASYHNYHFEEDDNSFGNAAHRDTASYYDDLYDNDVPVYGDNRAYEDTAEGDYYHSDRSRYSTEYESAYEYNNRSQSEDSAYDHSGDESYSNNHFGRNRDYHSYN